MHKYETILKILVRKKSSKSLPLYLTIIVATALEIIKLMTYEIGFMKLIRTAFKISLASSEAEKCRFFIGVLSMSMFTR